MLEASIRAPGFVLRKEEVANLVVLVLLVIELVVGWLGYLV